MSLRRHMTRYVTATRHALRHDAMFMFVQLSYTGWRMMVRYAMTYETRRWLTGHGCNMPLPFIRHAIRYWSSIAANTLRHTHHVNTMLLSYHGETAEKTTNYARFHWFTKVTPICQAVGRRSDIRHA